MKTFPTSLLAMALLLLPLLSCGEQGGTPFPELSPVASVLHVSIQTPRQAVLRALEEPAEDPLTAVHSLRLLFYTAGEAAQVTQVREIVVSSPSQLTNLPVSLPEGAYQLVVIANPTSRLQALTAIGSPLTALTTPQESYSGDWLTSSPRLQVSLLNASEPVAISPEAFGASASPVRVLLEPTLARVLLYGTPTLPAGASVGTAPAGYLIQPQAKTEVPLRPLGTLLSGGEETAEHRATDADVYPHGPLFTAWASSHPTLLTEHLRYFPLATLSSQQGEDYWTPVARDEAALPQLRLRSLCYAKETTLPASAYLTGAVPSLLIRYPYIPAGLSLSEGEGWLSYAGHYYSESAVKAGLAAGTLEDQALWQVLQRAGITEDSFDTPFEKEGLAFHYRAYSYYTLPIRHYEDAKAPEKSSPGRYGLVRGNEYRIQLTRILRPGRALPPDLASDLSPLTEEREMRASLEVRPLAVRVSEAHL